MKLKQTLNNGGLEKGLFGRYKVNKRDLDSYIIAGIAIMAVILSILFFINTETHWDLVVESRWKSVLKGIVRFTDTTGGQFVTIIRNLVYSVLLATAVTILTVLIALPVSVFSAKNLYKGPVSTFVKGVAAIFRAVPTIIWAMLFIPVFGLSITTAFVGMMFHSLAFFMKAFSESYEEVDPGITEALTATGANKIKIAYAAIMPASFKKIVGWVLLRIEINLAVVIIIAPAIGVPNSIGYLVQTYYVGGWYGQLGLVLTLIIITALGIEKISNKIVNKL